MEPEPQPCCFDEWAVSNAKRARRKDVSSSVTRSLIELVGGSRVDGSTVLDLGCGTGDFALATIARGATRATGVDLGPQAIEEARALARERGLADRSAFVQGDAAKVTLERHDVVVLNRVLCCYPHVDAFLANSLSAAGRVFALSAPRSSGIAGAFNRTWIGLGNLWYRMRRKKFRGFRAYVHDLGAVDLRIHEAGFSPVAEGDHRVVWHLGVYERAPSPIAS